MNAPERTQVETDAEREYYGQLTCISSPEGEDKARQEFKKESDINELLRRFGAVPPPRIPGGEWDFDTDLASAFDSVRRVRDGYRTLPAELREMYRTPQDLIQAILAGEVTYKSEEAAAGSSGAAEADSARAKPAPAEDKQKAAPEKA